MAGIQMTTQRVSSRARVLGGLVIVAAAIGMGVASPAAAGPTNCQTVGKSTVCGQGNVTAGPTQSAKPATGASAPSTGGCTNAYGTYQSCTPHS